VIKENSKRDVLIEKKQWDIVRVYHKAIEIIALIMLGIGIGRLLSC